MKKTLIGNPRIIMLKYLFSSLFLLSSLTGWGEDICLATLLQVQESTNGLSDTEYEQVIIILEKLGDTPVKAIYTANSKKALEAAAILADAYTCPVIIDERLQKILPKTLFKRIGDLRTFGLEVYTAHVDEEVIVIADESFINFVGKYTEGGFKKIQNFCHLQVEFDGESPSLPR